jgi:3,4-dihydroxy 2-butanone 4-phosphate synthase/GTP cyclohydrolase II
MSNGPIPLRGLGSEALNENGRRTVTKNLAYIDPAMMPARRSSVDTAIAAIRAGELVIVADSTDRENEGDLIAAAGLVTPELITRMLRHTSGLICVAMKGERLDELGIPLMAVRNTESRRTAFTVSVDARQGTTTGISAADRAATIAALGDPSSQPGDFLQPGHVFPLRYHEGGVLRRPGHTEAAVDLARLAGLAPAGVLCEVVNADGSMARRPQLEALAAAEGLVMITIQDLIEYRWRNEVLIERISSALMPTGYGTFTAHSYLSTVDDVEHIALVMGDVTGPGDVLTRVHSECLTGEALGSLRCDCGEQLQSAMQQVAAEQRGVIVYLRGHEGRGIGLGHKIRAYALQDAGFDTVDANLELGLPVDARTYCVAGQILRDLQATAIRLLTNNPDKCDGLDGYVPGGISRLPMHSPARAENVRYLTTKRRKLGHLPAGVEARAAAGGWM